MASFDLKHFDYHTLKDLSLDQEKELAQELRQEIILDVSHNGGHLSSNLGVVDLTISLLKTFDPLKDDILFDVGHQTYAYKILTGRDLTDLRKKNGPSGFQKIGESPCDKFESGHSSTSIPVGLGVAAAKKLAGIKDSYTVVVIGDSSIANGLALEGLNNLDEKVYGKLIIILNDNNMSISKPKGALSRFFNKVRTSVFYQEGAGKFKKAFNKKGISWIYPGGVHLKNFIKRIFTNPNFFNSFDAAYLGPIDGHNFAKMEKFLQRAKSIDSSVILHVRTKKGKGYPKAEEDESGYWHGTSAFDPETGLPMSSHPESVSFSHLGGEAILNLMKDDPKTVLITPAMKKGAHLEEAFLAFPTRSFDCGIAEECAVDMAVGFALKGLHPIVSIYSTFMQRAYDQLINDACRMKLEILLVVDRAGLVGADGASHQGLYDLEMTLGMPNMTIQMPSDGKDVSLQIQSASFNWGGPHIIRLERAYDLKAGLEETETNPSFVIDQIENSSSAFVGVGLEGKEAFNALKGELDVVLLKQLKPLPQEVVSLLLKEKRVFIYDPTSAQAGLASYLAKALLDQGYGGRVVSLGVLDTFVEHATKEEQEADMNLTPEQAAQTVLKEIKAK